MKITRTQRLLAVFHLFAYRIDISYSCIFDFFEKNGVAYSKKTISRDIKFLKQAGLIDAVYSDKKGAFVAAVPDEKRKYDKYPVHPLLPEFDIPPVLPETRNGRLYMEKIVRLCSMMLDMWGSDDPFGWYRDKYPNLSDRTRQRDFKELEAIGYEIDYIPKAPPFSDEGYYNWEYHDEANDIHFR